MVESEALEIKRRNLHLHLSNKILNVLFGRWNMKKHTRVKIKCDYCSKEFERVKKEVKRSQKLGRKFYCSRKCCGKDTNNSSTIKERIPKEKSLEGSRKGGQTRAKGDKYTPFRYFMKNIRNRLKHEYDVDLEYLKKTWEDQKGICPYTGVELTLPKKSYGFSKVSTNNASIDRIDSSKGYLKGNIQFVSYAINLAKFTFQHDEMIEFCKTISNHWK